MATGKRFAQDFTRIDEVGANDAILVQDGDDGVVKFANPSQLLAYVSENGGFATAEGLSAAQQVLNAKINTKQDELVSGDNIRTVAGKNIVGEGNVEITKADVGLGNVDNTSDTNKPISNATQQALDTLTTAVGQRVESETFEQYQAEQEEALDGKQDTLTLSVLNNGNIRIGNLAGTTKDFMPATPSGDPMHYAYEEVGAVWEPSTGCWKMYDMTDVTNEQMRKAYTRGVWDVSESAAFYTADSRVVSSTRFTLPRVGNFNEIMTDGNSFARFNVALEFVNLTFYAGTKESYQESQTWFKTAVQAFSGCTNLRRIYGIMVIDTSDLTNTFYNCTSLTTARIRSVKSNIDLHYSPLDVASATYIIANASSSATFSVTFKASMQATYEADADFVAAKDAKPNITINYL